MNQFEEQDLFSSLKAGEERAFEKLFRNYYAPLCYYASKILQNDGAAEEIVQDFFVRLWEKRADIEIETSLKNYFFRSVKNLCLNQIKHENVKIQHVKSVISEAELTEYSDHFQEVNLQKDIEKSIAALPEKRREIFRLSREEGLKYREIADKLNISIKTVEAHMGLAIKTLRDILKKYNSFLFLFLSFQKHTD